MSTKEVITFLAIHIVVPLIGLICFLILYKQKKKENISNAPTIEMFIIFSTYGGLLIFVLTSLFWDWSAMASLGTFYLVLVAPITMGLIAYRHRLTQTVSKYHRCTYLSGVLYFFIVLVTVGILFLVGK